MAFPLMAHMNSSRIALAPSIFLPMLSLEIIVDVLLLLAFPVIACAVVNAVVVHPNFRIISISTILHYAIGVLARFVIVFYEIYDLPVSRNDWLIFTADIARDHMLGYFISLLGMISFERYVATRFWEWYEGRHRGTLVIIVIAELIGSGPSLVKVMLCEYGYYPHEINFVVFGGIVLASATLYLVALTDNIRILRSLQKFSTQYTVNQLFQVRENLRVLKFTAIFIGSTIPIVTLSFCFFGVFFFAPLSWERERYICIALVDFCISILVEYAPAFFFIAIRGMREYHREIYKIRAFSVLANCFEWKPPSSYATEQPSKMDETRAYFDDLSRTWS